MIFFINDNFDDTIITRTLYIAVKPKNLLKKPVYIARTLRNRLSVQFTFTSVIRAYVHSVRILMHGNVDKKFVQDRSIFACFLRCDGASMVIHPSFDLHNQLWNML